MLETYDPNTDASTNPILSSPNIAVLAPKRTPSAAQRKVILAIGLRFRPQAANMQEAHSAKLAALLADTVDVPADLLDRAATEWSRANRWMPTAADLIRLAQAHVAPPEMNRAPGQTLADAYNARLARDLPKRAGEIEWVQTDDGPVIRWIA